MIFEPTGGMCAFLLLGAACAFGMVGHVQQSLRKMAKRTVKEFQEVSEDTPPTENTVCKIRSLTLRARQLHMYAGIIKEDLVSRYDWYYLCLQVHSGPYL